MSTDAVDRLSVDGCAIDISNFKNTSFGLVMFTYTYERQVIIQIALKRLPGGGECQKKGLSDLALPLHVII
jgi:hypothetical protein